jgi:8-oxo-dGTP pyrophosphatase MutT (NUDIX family)
MERNGPWQVRSSEVAYENPWIRVRHDEVITPHGDEGVYGVVQVRPAVGIVPLTADGHTYLVGQHRYPHGTYSWEIPEGAARDGEDPETAAHRELREETGLTAGRLSSLGTMHTSNCIMDETAHFFLAEDLDEGDPDPDPTELLEVRRVTFEAAMAMVRDGTIQDAMSIVALYRVAERLQGSGD